MGWPLFFWGPKVTGYMLNEPLGKIQFWLFFIGANLMVMPQYWLGLLGMPRRVGTYPHDPQWTDLNQVATVGAVIMGVRHGVLRRERRLLVVRARPGRRQPLGRTDARVVHDLAAAAPQLLLAASDPLGAPDVGLQPPRVQVDRARPHRGAEARA